MTIRFLGQSGYVIKTASTTVVIDPYLSDSVNRVANRPRTLPIPIAPEKLRADAVICTHNHLDHLDPDTVEKVDRKIPFITTFEGKDVLDGLGFETVKAIKVGDTVNVGDISITAVYANHTVEAFGLIVKADGMTLYFSGDTLFDEKLFEIKSFNPDMTFICINGRLGNMNVEEALTTAKEIGARVNVPNHYDMFASNSEDPHKFADHIDGGFIMDFNKEYDLLYAMTNR